MKKIAEMTMDELSVCMCKMAAPASNLFADGEVTDAFDEAQKRMPEKATLQEAFSIFSSVLVPVLMNEKHKAETYSILSAQSGENVDEIAARNGLEVMRDLFTVFMLERDVQTIFRVGAEVRPE